MKKAIFMLVGPSGSGKSTLMKEVTAVLGDKVGIIKSLTTRQKKEDFDDLSRDFVTPSEFRRRISAEELAEWVEYDNNLYGYEKTTINEVLRNKNGIGDPTEHGVIALMRAGYNVRAVKITPKHNPEYDNHRRIREDKERAKLHITYQKEIINSFKKGGKEKAAKELIEYIKGFVR